MYPGISNDSMHSIEIYLTKLEWCIFMGEMLTTKTIKVDDKIYYETLKAKVNNKSNITANNKFA